MSAQPKKLILVLGATGAQGSAVIDALLAPAEDGSPSPYAVRALTRDVNSRRALALKDRGIECVEGSTENLPTILAAMKGVYGVWSLVDGFTVGEEKETFAGIRLFELAKQSRDVRHYVWSSLDYVSKLTNYNPKYRCEHNDGKGRVADWMKMQPSLLTENEMSWSIITSGAYMDMLTNPMFGPVKQREDGTFVFVTPIGSGHAPMIALSDLGFFARYTFDHRSETSAKDLQIVSEFVGWDHLVSTFKKVTGQKAEVIYQSIDEWFGNLNGVDKPLATDLIGKEVPAGAGKPTTWRENFTCWWNLYRDDIIKRDLNWIKSIHPKTHTLESWMRENNYTGLPASGGSVLKNMEDGKGMTGNFEVIGKL